MIISLLRGFIARRVVLSLRLEQGILVKHGSRLSTLPAPFVMVSNMSGPLDSAYLLYAAQRELTVFGSQLPPISWWQRTLLALFLVFSPSNRSEGFLQAAGQVVRDYKVVACPGYQTWQDPELVAKLALTDMLLLVPCYIHRSIGEPTVVVVGRPLMPADEETPTTMTLRIQRHLDHLAQEVG